MTTLSRWRLRLLVAALIGLLAWAWATDRRSPVYPQGEFTPLVLWAALVISVVAGVVWLWRSGGESSRPDPPKDPRG